MLKYFLVLVISCLSINATAQRDFQINASPRYNPFYAGLAVYSGGLIAIDSVNNNIVKLPMSATATKGMVVPSKYTEPATKEQKLMAGGIERIAGRSFFGSDDGIGGDAAFNNPSRIIIENGTAYVTDMGWGTIRKIDIETKTVKTVNEAFRIFNTYGKQNCHALSGLVKIGNVLYIADADAQVIRKVDLISNERTILSGKMDEVGSSNGIGESASFKNPMDVATDGKFLYVADAGNGLIRRVDIENGSTSTLAIINPTVPGGARAYAAGPRGLFYEDGKLYVSDTMGGRILEIDVKENTIKVLASRSQLIELNEAAINPSAIVKNGHNLYFISKGQIFVWPIE
jgi:LVIVD repeat